MGREIDLGNLPIYVSKEHYDLFFNQQQKQETKSNRAVFKTDYQRFIWAFVLGIKKGVREPIKGKKESSFKWGIIPGDAKSLMLGLTLQELYSGDPEKIKYDVENADDNSFNEIIRQSIEEYANSGFIEIRKKTIYNASYIEDFEDIVKDILNNDSV